MRGAKQAGLGKVGGKVGVGEFVHLRRLLPSIQRALRARQGDDACAERCLRFGCDKTALWSVLDSSTWPLRPWRVLVRGEGSQTHPRIADYTVLCRSPRRRVTVYLEWYVFRRGRLVSRHNGW